MRPGPRADSPRSPGGKRWRRTCDLGWPRAGRRSLAVRLVSFLLGLALLWLGLLAAIALPAALAFGIAANATTLAAAIALYGAALGAIWLWGRQTRGWRQPFRSYGLGGQHFWPEVAIGLGLAIASLGLLFGTELALGWAEWQPARGSVAVAVGNGLLTGAAIGVLEELWFRGWLWYEFRASRWRSRAALASSAIFAALHFLKPLDVVLETWPQFLGLVLVGLALVEARFCSRDRGEGSLAMPVGLHGGWVFGITTVNLTGWIAYPDAVPAWIVGWGGNPLAGVAGVAFLAAVWAGLAVWARQRQASATDS